ncbi:DUF3999 family protein [Cryomorphaceae bacterium 1068]|nr:DUF3999 family protein [Cryomorphaceae bacterium 1068]
MSLKNNLLLFGLLLSLATSAQLRQYKYSRALNGINDQWHSIVLDDKIFDHTTQNLNDIRIYGITAESDTVEAPFFLQVKAEKRERKAVTFNQINVSSEGQNHYFTFEIPSLKAINEISLDFKQRNFDQRVKLEGSHSQNEWYTVLDDYRILSIDNDLADYQFTKLKFPSSNYTYYRLRITSPQRLELESASISSINIIPGESTEYTIRKMNIEELDKTNQTQIDLSFDQRVRLNTIEVNVADSFDYYRPIQIEYLSDSVKTEKGWVYRYKKLTNGVLNSMELNKFSFRETTLKKIRILIDNQDNEPLKIDELPASGFVHELICRFTAEADYYLVYGNANAARPNYDIARFKDKIPQELESLKLGAEKEISSEAELIQEPLFKNNIWLWVTIISLIGILGWFSLKMLKAD